MRVLTAILLILAANLSMFGAEAAKPPTFCASSVPGSAACNIPKQDLRAAKKAFERGVKLRESRHLDDALQQFEEASRLVPQDLEFATARELTRQQLVYTHIQAGNAALAEEKQVEAIAEFREALHLDPDNQFAQQQLGDVAQASLPHLSEVPRVVDQGGEIRLAPQPNRADFHFRGDSRELLTAVGQAFGISVSFDDSVLSRRVRFDIQNVDFDMAIQAASDVTHTFWTPMDQKQIMVAADNPQNHRQFDRMLARSFYLPGTTTPQELNDIVNALRTVFGITLIKQTPASGTITVRAPQRIMGAATTFLENLDTARPQVLVDLRLYQVSRSLVRDMGMHVPNQFNMYNITSAALAGVAGQSTQALINQLIASGGINQANSTSLSALLAQLQNQNSNSIFSQPLATFGAGLTLFGVSLDKAVATFSLNQSEVKDLQHAILRAGHGTPATFRFGSRYPILNATFSPVYNSSAISQVIGNQSYIPAFPSFNYEDLGLTVKIKPQIHSGGDVSMDMEVSVRSLGATSYNGIPVINDREYKGSIGVADGEPAVVAGSVTRNDTYSMNGIPGFGSFPLLNRVMTSNSQENDEDELLLVVTPHIVAAPSGSESTVWMSGTQ